MNTKLGPYEITAKLGEGGMGEVYRATDTKLKREVAIKVLPAAFTADHERLSRFEREAQLLAQLHHPNIASIFGLEESGGVRALVMELVPGPTLAELIAAGPLPLADALRIALEIARALEAAHEKGIVHRDLKPQNIKASLDGVVKVLDFGLAKAMDPVAGSSAAEDLARSPTMMNSPTLTAAGTQLGVILGTAAYMAPEQARGGAVDKRADIWAFGVVVYEMLTGRSLFAGPTVSDTLAGVLKTEIDFGALPASLPAELKRLLGRCLERNPKNRLHDIADARLVIEDLVAGRVDAPAAGPMPVVDRRTGRRAYWLSAGALALLFALAGYALGRRAAGGGASRSPAAAPVAARFQQITDAPGVESSPSLSPDGKDVVYTRMVDGQHEILIQRVGARVSTPLSGGLGFDDRQPAFSPDGERIAFRSERDGGGVFVMDTSGESVRRISDFGFHPTWSPDGKELALAAGDFYNPNNRGGAARGLSAFNVASGERREISSSGDVMQPSWSPRGRRIAYWGLRHQSGQRDLFTIAADGSEAESGGRTVTDDTALDWSPTWSPDGRFLYYASNRGGTMNLWRLPIDEASGETRGAPEPVTAPSLWTGFLSFSRDGTRLAYGSLDWRTTLYRAELDVARGRLAGTPAPLLKGTQPIRDHQLSPDGEWITFMRMAPQEDLFVARIDGSQSRRLTDDVFRDRGPTWSPDGKRIAFYSDRSGSYQLWTIHTDGSGLEKLTDSKESSINFPVWSPDGRRIATNVIPGGGKIFDLDAAIDVATARALPPLADGRLFWPLSWSRDGRRLAGIVVLDSGGIEAVATHDLTSGSYERIELGSGRSWRFPHWLSDSRRLVVRDGRGVWLLDPGREEPRLLVAVGGDATGVSVGLTRDDRWLTWSETGTEGDVWLAELGEIR